MSEKQQQGNQMIPRPPNAPPPPRGGGESGGVVMYGEDGDPEVLFEFIFSFGRVLVMILVSSFSFCPFQQNIFKILKTKIDEA